MAPHELQLDSASEDETAGLGRALAEALEPGTCVALVGNLGAGKTRLVQAIARALGVDRQQAASPTFVLIHEYSGRLPLYHFDAYRLKDSDEFLDLGAGELLEGEGVCLIEWADRVADALPRDRLTVTLAPIGETSRRLTFTAGGAQSQRVLDRFRELVTGGE